MTQELASSDIPRHIMRNTLKDIHHKMGDRMTLKLHDDHDDGVWAYRTHHSFDQHKLQHHLINSGWKQVGKTAAGRNYTKGRMNLLTGKHYLALMHPKPEHASSAEDKCGLHDKKVPIKTDHFEGHAHIKFDKIAKGRYNTHQYRVTYKGVGGHPRFPDSKGPHESTEIMRVEHNDGKPYKHTVDTRSSKDLSTVLHKVAPKWIHADDFKRARGEIAGQLKNLGFPKQGTKGDEDYAFDLGEHHKDTDHPYKNPFKKGSAKHSAYHMGYHMTEKAMLGDDSKVWSDPTVKAKKRKRKKRTSAAQGGVFSPTTNGLIAKDETMEETAAHKPVDISTLPNKGGNEGSGIRIAAQRHGVNVSKVTTTHNTYRYQVHHDKGMSELRVNRTNEDGEATKVTVHHHNGIKTEHKGYDAFRDGVRSLMKSASATGRKKTHASIEETAATYKGEDPINHYILVNKEKKARVGPGSVYMHKVSAKAQHDYLKNTHPSWKKNKHVEVMSVDSAKKLGVPDHHYHGLAVRASVEETAAPKDHDSYTWHTFKGARGVNLHYRGKPHTMLRKGMRFGLRKSADGKSHRLVTEANGPNIVHSISHDHADKLAERSRKVRKEAGVHKAVKLKPEEKVKTKHGMSIQDFRHHMVHKHGATLHTDRVNGEYAKLQAPKGHHRFYYKQRGKDIVVNAQHHQGTSYSDSVHYPRSTHETDSLVNAHLRTYGFKR